MRLRQLACSRRRPRGIARWQGWGHASSRFEPDCDWGERVGDQVLICEIPRLQLVPGEYRVDVALMVAGELVDKVEDALRITIMESDYYGTGQMPRWGTCVLEQHWRLA